MKKLVLAISVALGLVAAPVAAQDAALDAQLADELPGLEQTESEFFPAGPEAPAAWQKIFRSGNNVVTVSVQDFAPDSGLVLANAWRVAANAYELGYEDLYLSEGVELGPVASYVHPDHPGVRISERTFDNRVYFMARYLEGTHGFLIVAVLEDNSLFDPLLAAQLDHSTGPRIDWEGNGGVLSVAGESGDSAAGADGGSGGIIILVGAVVLIAAAGGWWFVRRSGDAD